MYTHVHYIYSIYTNICRFNKCDSTYNAYSIPPTLWPSSSLSNSPVNQKHLIFLLEQLWHKCTEIRSYLYYSFLIRDDDDFGTTTTSGSGSSGGGGSGVDRSIRTERDATMRRIKRIKDLSIDDYLDITSTRGRLETGALHKIKMLSAHTVASKLLAEPYLYANYQYKMKQMNIRQQMYNNDDVNLKKSALMSFFNINTNTTTTAVDAGGTESDDAVAMEVDDDEKGEGEGKGATATTKMTTDDEKMDFEEAEAAEGGGENDTAADTNDNDDDGASESATSTPKRRRTSPRISSTTTQQHDTEDDGDGDGDIYDTSHSTAIHYTPRSVSRYVEMCHIHTGEVLRLFLNQKSASLVLGVTQSGK